MYSTNPYSWGSNMVNNEKEHKCYQADTTWDGKSNAERQRNKGKKLESLMSHTHTHTKLNLKRENAGHIATGNLNKRHKSILT